MGISDGMTVPFAVTASLAGVTNARLVMLAGLAELIAGAISMAAGGVLGAKSDKYVSPLHLPPSTYRETYHRCTSLEIRTHIFHLCPENDTMLRSGI